MQIDQETMKLWPKALTNAGLRRAGCDSPWHCAPLPEPTPALLWEMLEKYRISLWWSPSNKCWQAHLEGGLTVSGETAAAAVIRAMAAHNICGEPIANGFTCTEQRGHYGNCRRAWPRTRNMPNLYCPYEYETATGIFDPAGYDPSDCAGCGCKKAEHQLVCPRCDDTRVDIEGRPCICDLMTCPD